MPIYNKSEYFVLPQTNQWESGYRATVRISATKVLTYFLFGSVMGDL